MASSAKKVSLCLLLTLLCSLHTHARDSQFFNKIPSTTNNVVVPTNQQEEQQQPNFLPQNENSYGLYGHESGQNPPSTAAATTAATTTTPDATTTTPFETEFKQPEHKYLPKNYNPVAYVTVPENDDVKESIPFNEETNFSTNNNNNNEKNNNENNNSFYTGEETYYNNQQQEGEPEEEEEAEFRKYPTAAAANNNNYYYNGGSRFNSQPESNAEFRTGAASTNRRENYYFNNNGGSSFNSQPQGDTDFIDAAALTSRGNYFDNGAGANGFQPQGMSDTRFVENGKYFYDVNSGKYSSNHPYQSLRGAQAQNQNKFSNRNLFGNNANQFNAGGFNNREEFQYEENMP